MTSDQRKLLQLDIKDAASAFCERANMHVENENPTAALSDYNLALYLNPRFAIAYNNRAYLFMQLNEFQTALDDINVAIELEDDSCYYNTRGYIYHQMGKFEESLADYKQAITIDPDYDPPYIGAYYVRDDIQADAENMLTSLDIKRVILPCKPNSHEWKWI